jgi:hypothetical protein
MSNAYEGCDVRAAYLEIKGRIRLDELTEENALNDRGDRAGIGAESAHEIRNRHNLPPLQTHQAAHVLHKLSHGNADTHARVEEQRPELWKHDAHRLLRLRMSLPSQRYTTGMCYTSPAAVWSSFSRVECCRVRCNVCNY